MAGALALASTLLGVPVVGNTIGRDADFAIMSLHLLTAAWRDGDVWPRWLMDAGFGLGGTVFYSYPPLAFWAAAAIACVTGLDSPAALGLAMAAWRALAVLTAWLWLRRQVPEGAAIAGAAFAALLPYGALIDPWMRFAYSETAALALLPLLLLALEMPAGQRGLPAILGIALAYGALALTNLPLCVLAAHLGPLYAWGYAGRAGLVRAVLGGLAGAGLAGAFLLPAIGLLPSANAAEAFNPSWRENLMFFSEVRPLLAVTWGAILVTLGCGVWLMRAGRPAARLAVAGWPRALLVLLVAASALTTVVTLPLWWALPQLAATEHPWRATAFLGPAVGGFAARAIAAGLRPLRLALAGFALALLTPAFLAALLLGGSRDWPKFLPSEQRLAFARSYGGAFSWEHLPREAAAAGWAAVIAGAPDPHPRPALPAGTTRLARGYAVPAADAPFTLPQFYFPAWTAADAAGPVAVRPSPAGLLEVIVDRPVRNLVVEVGRTGWEWAGWTVSAATAVLLALLVLPRRRLPRQVAHPRPPAKA